MPSSTYDAKNVWFAPTSMLSIPFATETISPKSGGTGATEILCIISTALDHAVQLHLKAKLEKSFLSIGFILTLKF